MGRASFVDRSKNRRKNNVIMKVFVWLLQRVTEMVRNFVLIDVSWPTLRRCWLGIFRRVSVVSYKIFAMAVVACKREEQRETIVGDQRGMDIGKAADAVIESEYVGGKLKRKTPSISSLKSRERTMRTKCKTSERLCAKSKDFKLVLYRWQQIFGGNKKLRKRIKKCKIEILYFRVYWRIRRGDWKT